MNEIAHACNHTHNIHMPAHCITHFIRQRLHVMFPPFIASLCCFFICLAKLLLNAYSLPHLSQVCFCTVSSLVGLGVEDARWKWAGFVGEVGLVKVGLGVEDARWTEWASFVGKVRLGEVGLGEEDARWIEWVSFTGDVGLGVEDATWKWASFVVEVGLGEVGLAVEDARWTEWVSFMGEVGLGVEDATWKWGSFFGEVGLGMEDARWMECLGVEDCLKIGLVWGGGESLVACSVFWRIFVLAWCELCIKKRSTPA